MRKEVRIGGVIGGVLVVGMIVYSIVGSKSHSEKKKDQVVFDPGKSSTGTAGGTTTDATTGHDDALTALTHMPLSGEVAASPPAAPAHTDDAAPAAPIDGKPATNWGALLSADRVEDVLPVHTNTPALAAATDAPAPPTPADHSTSTDAPTHLPAPDAETPAKHTDRPSDAHVRTSPATGGTTHRIASGETFSSIARSVYGDGKYYKLIVKANPKIDPTHLKPGMVINLPDKSQVTESTTVAATPPTTRPSAARPHNAVAVATINTATQYRVQSTDSLYKISMKLYHSPNKVDAIYQLNKGTIGADPAKLKLNMVLQLPEPPAQTASR